jgi:epoxide hydrolase-like predicted phosphatase
VTLEAVNVEAVVFDYGGVICVDPFVGLAVLEHELGLPAGALSSEFRGGSNFREAELGRLPLAEFMRTWYADVARRWGVNLDSDATHAALRRGGDLNPATIDLIERLSTTYRMAILTNNIRESRGRRERMLPPGYFELVIDSSEVGLRKPDVEIYELLLARLDLEGPQVVYVDDFEENLAPAKALGMHTVLFTDATQCERALGALGVTVPQRDS